MLVYQLRYEFPTVVSDDESGGIESVVLKTRTVIIRASDDRAAMRIAKSYVSRQGGLVHNGEKYSAKMLLVVKTVVIYEAPENSSPPKG